eukprot:scaffold7083_cov137-Skeletonema_marinoi.AAC.1
MANLPTDAEIRSKMESLIKTVDLNTMSTKQFIAALSDKFDGADLSSKKKFIKGAITEILDAMGDEEDNGDDPSDKRQIILDDKMKAVFGKDVESFSMFTMNKYISPHIHPFKPLDLTPSTRKRKAEDGGSGRKKKKEQKKKAPGMQAPYRLSDDLVAVVGKSILPRPQVTQALWKYIRENDLQNPEDKREILCDAKLKRVLGGNSKVTMFSMNKYITAHLLEKMDKSAYVHVDIDSGKKEEEVSSVGEVEDSDDDSV